MTTLTTSRQNKPTVRAEQSSSTPPIGCKFQGSKEEATWVYLIEERLGILCGDQKPTPEQLKIAHWEADQWLAEMQRK